MVDYQSNANKNKGEPKPEKKIEKIVSSEVIVQKKSIGRKFHDLFVEADVKSVFRYVIHEVLIPAAQHMVVDASAKGVERLMYGERAGRYRGISHGPRITYNNPINRGYREGITRQLPSMQAMSRSSSRSQREDLILSSKEEAELVLDTMNDILDTYEVVSVADLYELIGQPSSHTDNKWGWIYLGGAQVRTTRDGFLLDLPPAEHIQ